MADAAPDWFSSLHAADPFVRRRAALSMAHATDAPLNVLAALHEALRDPHWLAREAAAYALGQCGRSTAAETTRQELIWIVLHDRHPLVQDSAARALVALRGAVTASVAELCQALQQGHVKVQRKAARALAHFPDEGRTIVPVLRAALRDSHAAVRRAAIVSLGRLGPAAAPALPDLVRKAYEREHKTRLATTRALEHLLPTLPAVLQLGLSMLVRPDHSPEENLHEVLTGAALSPTLIREFTALCARRAAWHRQRATGDIPREPDELATPWEAACTAATLAARARGTDEARAQEFVWQLAWLCQRLLEESQQPETVANKAP
jgi:HEAT repeat protein